MQLINNINKKSGFTLIELLITCSITILVILAVAPWLYAIENRDNPGVRLAYTDVMYNLFSQLRNSTAGYGWLSVDKGEKDKVNMLPEAFVIVFQSDFQDSKRAGSMYNIETQTRSNGATQYMRIIRKEALEHKKPGLYLKRIIARRDDADAVGTVFSNVAISHINPSGNLAFYFDNSNFLSEWNVAMSEDSANTVNEFLKPTVNKDYQRVDLEFFDQNEKRSFTIQVYKDMQYYTDLD